MNKINGQWIMDRQFTSTKVKYQNLMDNGPLVNSPKSMVNGLFKDYRHVNDPRVQVPGRGVPRELPDPEDGLQCQAPDPGHLGHRPGLLRPHLDDSQHPQN